MKRRLFVLIVVITVLFAFAVPVGASPKAETKFGGGAGTPGGITFTFYVDENLSNGQLRGNVSWDGGSTPMTCGNQEGNVVTCSVPRSALDKRITVTFNGSSWVTFVKSQPYCYPVYDYDESISIDGSDPASWYEFGPYCQDEPADFNATEPTIIYNPYYGFSFQYWYWDKNCYNVSFGVGFYYNCWY